MQKKTSVPMGFVKLRIYRATEPPTKQKRNASALIIQLIHVDPLPHQTTFQAPLNSRPVRK